MKYLGNASNYINIWNNNIGSVKLKESNILTWNNNILEVWNYIGSVKLQTIAFNLTHLVYNVIHMKSENIRKLKSPSQRFFGTTTFVLWN